MVCLLKGKGGAAVVDVVPIVDGVVRDVAMLPGVGGVVRDVVGVVSA